MTTGSDWDDVQKEINSSTGSGFYNPTHLKVGESETIAVLRYAKNSETKYPIKEKDGRSLGFGWRFFLSDGRVWDLSNSNRKTILAALHAKGKDSVIPTSFKVTNTGIRSTKQPQHKIEVLGAVSDEIEL